MKIINNLTNFFILSAFITSFLFSWSHVTFLLSFLGIVGTFYCHYKSNEQNRIDPLTPEEWKRISRITALREGSSHGPMTYSPTFSFGRDRAGKRHNCLEASIESLCPGFKEVSINQYGEIVQSPWIITKSFYLKN